MRLLLTAVAPTGEPLDVAVDVDADGQVGDLGLALAEQVPSLRVAQGPVLVRNGRPAAASAAVPLYLGDELIDPRTPLARSGIRHGCVLGAGAPVGELSEPDGAVEIRVVSGSGAGAVVRWDPGEYVVGATGRCDLTVREPAIGESTVHVRVAADGQVWVQADAELATALTDPPERARPLPGPIVVRTDRVEEPEKTSRRRRRRSAGDAAHERVLPDGTEMVDPNDAAPLVHLERRPLTDPLQWQIGEVLRIGGVGLQRHDPTAPDASLSPSPGGATLDFNRPPRLLPPQRQTTFTLPAKPNRPDKQPIPIAMMLLPAVLGLGMYLVSRSPYSLLIMAMTPLMALSSFTTSRRMGKRRYRADMQTWTTRMRSIQGQALDALVEERGSRRRDFADAAEVLMTAVGPRARLWERRPADPDWLMARVGTADQVSEVRITDPEREEHEGPVVWTAPDVPVTIPLGQVGVSGIAGSDEDRTAVARLVLAQTAVQHSPTQLSIALLTTADRAQEWNWVRWLPHVRSGPDDAELAMLGTDEETWARRISELTARMAQNAERASDAASVLPALPPVLVVLDGARTLRLLPGMITLLQSGPRYGVYFLCLDDDSRLLPEECQLVADLRADGRGGARGVVTRTGYEPVEDVVFDEATPAWAERLARALAPVRDVTDADASSALPDHSRLLDVLKLDVSDCEGIVQRWAQVGRTTAAVVGESAEGGFEVDIRRDGPHGLVAGTTGSGKSELLQTIIASLAVLNRPDEMNFVLVDYKGGAAFKDCSKLPHTVGMVTDLDGHLTTRALESLGAELRRREGQLADADAKDIEDYLAAKGPDDEPMPRLLIIIDEFAALVAELPDFVTGLVDIARRGRSLGVHLILATQRPAGVVSAEIKSNTNLRIALRVTDAEDSGDVIESPVAAHISKATPGRAYARLGHSSLVPFQSARVGGRAPDVAGPAAVQLRDMSFAALGASAEQVQEGTEEDSSVPTDLALVVRAANDAASRTGIAAPPPPWLPALPDVVTLDELLGWFPDAVPAGPNLAVPFGLADVPREQRRDVAAYDLARDGHLGVVGASRSGRSYLLRALAGAIGQYVDPRDVHIYGVDCGNNALLPLVALPHVGAVVSRDQTDRMARLVARLAGIVSARQQQLAMQGYADIAEQRAATGPEDRLPYLLVLFDRWEGFVQAYDSIDNGRLIDGWMQLMQEGVAVGVKVVVTGDNSLTVGRLATLTDDKLMLRRIDPSDFGAIGMSAKQVPAHMPDGRLFRANGLREIQVLLHDADPSGTAQVAALQSIARAASEKYADLPFATRPFRVDVLPMRMTMSEAAALGNEIPDTVVPFVVGGDTLQYRGLDTLRHGPGLMVTGPRGSGRSTTLLSIAEYVLAKGWQVGIITPRISPLRDLRGREGVLGWFSSDDAQLEEIVAALETLRTADGPTLLLIDDLELVDVNGRVSDEIETHLAALRDSGSLVVAAGSPAEMVSSYRGPVAVLKRSGSGVMLAPQSSSDTDLFGVILPRSALGVPMPPGAGYLVSAGQVERVQVVVPDQAGAGARG